MKINTIRTVLAAFFVTAVLGLDGCSRPAYGQASLSTSPREYKILVVQSSLEARQPGSQAARDNRINGDAATFSAELMRLLRDEKWVLKEMVTLENPGRETWAILWR